MAETGANMDAKVEVCVYTFVYDTLLFPTMDLRSRGRQDHHSLEACTTIWSLEIWNERETRESDGFVR